ncbi:hypothetical protein V8E51_004037 [Hyaloscypha variabilis]
MSSKQISLPNRDVPIEVIDSLLGQGLRYDEWEARMKTLGYGHFWNETLKNAIIKREFEYFKDEILQLRREPNTASKGKDVQNTNSSESIMKRLQGQEWVKGKRSEKEQRLQSKRLLGKDAKKRAFQQYVKNWEQAEPSGTSSAKFYGETNTPASQSVAKSAKKNEAFVSASAPMDSQLSPTRISPPTHQTYGSTQPTMQGIGWRMQKSDPSSSYSPSANLALYSPTAYQLSPPSYRPQNPTSQTSNASAFTSTHSNSVDGYQMDAAEGTPSTANTTPPAPTNTAGWVEGIYSIGLTEDNDAASQLDWMAANNDVRHS